MHSFHLIIRNWSLEFMPNRGKKVEDEVEVVLAVATFIRIDFSGS